MKDTFSKARTYVTEHSKQFQTGAIVVVLIGLIFGGLALYSYNTAPPKIVYEPANACDLLTLDEAKTLLGDKTINGINKTPVQSKDVTVSQCGYSDGLPDTANAMVAAIMVRTGINDAGIAQNKREFEAGKPSAGLEEVAGIGDKAYFNTGKGQLNVLKDSTWLLLSYGNNATPSANTLEDLTKLAKLTLNKN
jgi:hypothetical protein